MTIRLILLAVLAALAAPAAAAAGGWATVGLDPPPDGLAPGEPWQVELTVLQHGQTPLEGVRPTVFVRRDGKPDSKARGFPARPAGEPGVYRATVVFRAAGTWDYVVDDGFAARHTFPPVRIGKAEKRSTRQLASIGPPANPGGGGPDYPLAALAAAAAALAAGAGASLAQRRRGGPGPAGG